MASGCFPVAGKPEALTKQYLIEPLLRLLGWSDDPSQEFHYAPEFSGGMDKKWEDLVLLQDHMPLIFVETKGLFEKELLTDRNVNELLNYMKEYNRKNKDRYRIDWGVLTNFRELYIFYVSDSEPFYSLSFRQYLSEVTTLEQLLSVEDIKHHGIDRFYSESMKERLGDAFLEDLKKWRLILANGFFLANPNLTIEQLKETSQQVLDRLIFIRMLETLGILPPNWLGNIFAQWQQGKNYLNKTFSEVMREQFAAIESLYDTELFLHKLCDDLSIGDDYLEEILKIQGPAKGNIHQKIGFAGQTSLDDKGIYGYNFSTLTFDIMGSAYERYLAHRITIKEQRVAIEETKELRRKEGTYYTPTYVVEHIIGLAIQPRLTQILEEARRLLAEYKFKEARQKISELSSFRILDPACGSGSFLIKAFEAIASCYSQFNTALNEASQKFLKERGLAETSEINFQAFMVDDVGERILLENLYGVDFDAQAVEVAKLNLWTKMLSVNPFLYRPEVGKKQKKLLPSLMTKIKCGNSLFSPIALSSNIASQMSATDIARLIEMRRKLWEAILEMSPAHSGNKTNQEIDALRRIFDSLSIEEAKLRSSLTDAVEEQLVADEKSYFKIEGDHYMELQGRPFAWQLEFPEVFFETGGEVKQNEGFDAVIGNPPHGAELTSEERRIVEEWYELGRGYKNTAFLFIERAHEILRLEAQLGLVIPKSLTFSQEWEKVRDFVSNRFALREIADISKAFKGVLLEQVVLTAKKGQPSESFIGIHLDESGASQETLIPTSLCQEMTAFPIHADSDCLKIYEKIKAKSAGRRFGSITQTCRGFPLQGKVTKKKSKDVEPVLRGDELKPYMIITPSSFVKKKEFEEEDEKVKMLREPKILSQNIVAHVLSPRDHLVIMAVVDGQGILNLDTAMNTLVVDAAFPIHYLCAIMNSKLASWFTYVFIYNKAVRTMHFDEYYINKIPVMPTVNSITKDLASASKKLHNLVPQLARIDVDFRHYIDNYPRIRDGKLDDYYTPVLHSEKKAMVDPILKGTVTNIFSRIDGEWLIVLADYESADHAHIEKREILRLRIQDREVRQFLCTAINWAEKRRSSGNILSVVLKTAIPRFSERLTENLEIMRKLSREYSAAIEKYEHLATEIEELERQINETIYSFYGLDAKEINSIEDMFGGESIVLSLFPKPRSI